MCALTNKCYTKRVNSRSGQVGIAVLLIMVVLSTIGISIAARTTQDIQTSRQSQEAVQTFTAAESAVENILSQGQDYLLETSSGQYTDVTNANVAYTITSQTQLNTKLLQGSVAEVNVTGAAAGQQVRIEWSNTSDCTLSPASLVVAVVNNNSGTPVARYESYAICERSDGFTLISDTGATLARQVLLTLQAGDVTLRVTPIYNDTDILVNGVDWTLPTQQFLISSVAKNLLGRETKAIEVDRTTDYAPALFDYALVSGATILK